MYYPRFTKAIIHHFITKDKSISIRNIMFMHTAEDDSILGPMRFVSKVDDYQVYGAQLLEVMTNQKMRDSPTYKTYLAFTTGVASPKKARKFKKLASPSKKRTLAQVKKVLKRSQRETTIHQAGGSSDGTGSKPGVLDEPKGKSVDTHKGTGLKQGVPDVSKVESSKSEYESWGDSGDEANVQGDDEDVQDSDDDPQQADDERTDSENQEINDDEEESDNEFVHTSEDYVPNDDEANDKTKYVDEEEYERISEELYGDVNVRLTDAEHNDEEKGDADMINVAHV
ncbi:hypothetical protein Tco_0405061 [Tanacetum coccineum]